MKRILLTTTSLILAAGVAHSEVTFSGKGELGFNRTAKSAAVAVVAGRDALITGVVLTATDDAADFADGDMVTTATTTTSGTDKIEYVNGVLTTTKATTNSAAASAVTADELSMAKGVVATAKALVVSETAVYAAAVTDSARKSELDDLNEAKAELALAEAYLAALTGTAAVAAKKAGDFVAYSGYDLNVAVSGAADNGMTYSMGFDMGAGQIADRDDDRAMDNMGTTIAASALTIGYNGVTYVVGQNEIDDLYDDSQNGDVKVAGSMGGISYTLVADLDKDTKAVAASTKYTVASAANAGDSTFVETAAVAAVHESTSLKLSGAAGALGWSLTSTNKNDSGDAASAVNLSYAAGDAFTFAVNHDTKGKAAAITKLTATYVMDALTLSLSTANDKNHAGNTNTSSKASQNLSLAYAAGPMKATFATDESSAWSVVTQYDLGGGAQAFATVDHTEFAVLGLSFAF